MTRLALALALLLSTHAHAAAQTDPRTEASAHFQRGTDLFNEGRYDAALAEFQRAYEIAPALPVLYNLARVHAELGHPVDAAHAYERYLAEGGTTLAAARRTEVEHALAQQRDRIGRLRIVTNVEGAIISIDGHDVATAPLAAPLELGSGTHAIGLHAPGYEGVTREISIAGTVEASLEVELRREIAERGTLRVASSLPGVSVHIDGREVGTTPLSATLPVPVGDHEVSGTRAGYVADAHRVHVDDGAEVDVTLRLTPDPAAPPETMGELQLALPSAPSVVRVDGEPVIGRALRLQIGPHHVAVEVEGREPWSSDVSVEAGMPLALTPPLAWTARERIARVAAADGQRTAGIGLAIAGAALVLIAAPIAFWNEGEISSTDSQVVAVNQMRAMLGCAHAETTMCLELAAHAAPLQDAQNTENIVRAAAFTAVAVGAVLSLVVGLSLVLTAGSPDDVDASAHATLRVGPNGISVDGVF